jgi:hypothetical protein
MSNMVQFMARAKSVSRTTEKTLLKNGRGVTSDVIKDERGELQPIKRERSATRNVGRLDLIIHPAASSSVANERRKFAYDHHADHTLCALGMRPAHLLRAGNLA